MILLRLDISILMSVLEDCMLRMIKIGIEVRVKRSKDRRGKIRMSNCRKFVGRIVCLFCIALLQVSKNTKIHNKISNNLLKCLKIIVSVFCTPKTNSSLPK